MARQVTGLLKSSKPQNIEPDFDVPAPSMPPSKPAVYPEQMAVFVAHNKPRANRKDIVAVGRAGGVDSGIGVVGEGAVGVGGANMMAADTRAPGAAGSPALAIVTAAVASADTWVLSWTVPSDQTQTPLLNQVRYLEASAGLTDASFVASGTLWGDWAADMDSQSNWLFETQPTSNANEIVLFPTASPAPSGACQFGIRYKNGLGNLGSIATASATF